MALLFASETDIWLFWVRVVLRVMGYLSVKASQGGLVSLANKRVDFC